LNQQALQRHSLTHSNPKEGRWEGRERREQKLTTCVKQKCKAKLKAKSKGTALHLKSACQADEAQSNLKLPNGPLPFTLAWVK